MAGVVQKAEELAAVADEPVTTVFDPTDQGFRSATLAGAMLGAVLSAEPYWVEHLGTNLFELLDAAFARLEDGLLF